MRVHTKRVVFPGDGWPPSFLEVGDDPREVVDRLEPLPYANTRGVFIKEGRWPLGNDRLEVDAGNARGYRVEMRLVQTPTGVPFPIDGTDREGRLFRNPRAFELASGPVNKVERTKLMELSGGKGICWVDKCEEPQVPRIVWHQKFQHLLGAENARRPATSWARWRSTGADPITLLKNRSEIPSPPRRRAEMPGPEATLFVGVIPGFEMTNLTAALVYTRADQVPEIEGQGYLIKTVRHAAAPSCYVVGGRLRIPGYRRGDIGQLAQL